MSDDSLLTSEHVVKLKAEYDQWQAALKEAQDQVASIERKLDAVKTLIGEDRFAELLGDDSEAKTWAEWIKHMLMGNGGAAESTRLLLLARRDRRLAARVNRAPNVYHNTVQRMVRRGELVKWSNWLLLPDVARGMRTGRIALPDGLSASEIRSEGDLF